MSTPLKRTSNSPPLERCARLASRLGDRHADLQAAARRAAASGLQRADPAAHAGPVVGADHRERGGEHQAVGGHRRQGLVHVHHVEAAVADEALGAAAAAVGQGATGATDPFECTPVGRPITNVT